MKGAFDWLLGKRKLDGLWYLEDKYKGHIHFELEQVGRPSRFLTSVALYVLKPYGMIERW